MYSCDALTWLKAITLFLMNYFSIKSQLENRDVVVLSFGLSSLVSLKHEMDQWLF